MARSLNKAELIGNLTKDPELRYTPSGIAVCTFTIATDRSWTTASGEKKEEADFHRIVAWNKLAEICSKFLTKGTKAYVSGRLSTRKYTGQDGTEKYITEITAEDMILLGSKASSEIDVPEDLGTPVASATKTSDEVATDDIPFGSEDK